MTPTTHADGARRCGTEEALEGTVPADDRLLGLVERFCGGRRVLAGTRLTPVPNLAAAVKVLALKGPDFRWRSINAHGEHTDFAPAREEPAEAATARTLLHLVTRIETHRRRPALPSWCLRHTVVSAAHFARFSAAIRAAEELGLGWLIPAHRELLVVPRPTVRTAEAQPALLHDDTGRMAAEWSDGTGYYFLRGAHFDPSLYHSVIEGDLTLSHIASLADADQRSAALTYLSFARLVDDAGALLVDRGEKGTNLYRLRLPATIARDRPYGYGVFDYFIHMRDASHPEREFIEWVDPAIGRRGDAELCQAHAFGITREQWLSITVEG